MIKFSLFCTALLMAGTSVAAQAEYPKRPIRLTRTGPRSEGDERTRQTARPAISAASTTIDAAPPSTIALTSTWNPRSGSARRANPIGNIGDTAAAMPSPPMAPAATASELGAARRIQRSSRVAPSAPSV